MDVTDASNHVGTNIHTVNLIHHITVEEVKLESNAGKSGTLKKTPSRLNFNLHRGNLYLWEAITI